MKLHGVFLIPLFCMMTLGLADEPSINPAKDARDARAGYAGILANLLPSELIPLGSQVLPVIASGLVSIFDTAQTAVLAFGVLYFFYFVLAFFFPSIPASLGVPVASSAIFRSMTDVASEIDVDSMIRSINAIDLPESSFRYLDIKENVCKTRAMCELGDYVVTKYPMVGTVIRMTSKFLPGMGNYSSAIVKGTRHPDCSLAFPGCSYSPKQKLFRS